MIDIRQLKKFLLDGGVIYLDGTDEEIADALKYLFFESNIQNDRQSWFSDYFTASNEWNNLSFENWKYVFIDENTGTWNMLKDGHRKLRQRETKIISFSAIASEFADDDSADDTANDVSLSSLYEFM